MKTLEEVKKHFSNAKTVVDLASHYNAGEVDIEHFSITKNEHSDLIWATCPNMNETVVLYDGKQLAEITSYIEPLVKYTNNELKEVQKPKHYSGEVDVIDFVKMHNLNFNEGNIVKYVTRARRKDNRLEDLKKALDYIQREINYIEKEI